MIKKILILVIAGLICGAAAWWWMESQTETKPLTLSGNVDIRSVNTSFRVGGRLETLCADEGTAVRQGDLLGKLDAEPYEIALQQTQAAVRVAEASVQQAQSNELAARAALELLQIGYRAEEIEQARAELAAQEVLLLNAEKEHKRMESLLTQRAVSEQNYDTAKRNMENLRGIVDAKRARYTLLSNGYRKEEIARAEAQLGAATTAVAEAKARLQSARVQEKQAQLNLRDTQLKAPADGILLTRAVEPGTLLQPGATVYTISLRHPVWVRAYVDEVYLDKIHPGQKVRVRTDGGQAFDGVISFVSPQAEFTPKTVETADIRTTLVYRLRITLSGECKGLNQGAPVVVEIVD